MNSSQFIAQLLGVMYLTVGVGILINPDYYKKLIQSFYNEASSLYLGGVCALVVGFLIVTFHNVWEGWMIVITLVGWLALLKGIIFLTKPALLQNLVRMWENKLQVAGFVAVCLGALLCYFGYFA